MNIKSLLLGSATAMVAVSSAQAADALVVEPEPAEYVRVCDAYGSGFFFIPGTETCIRFGGFIRSTYERLEFDSVTTRANNAAAPTAVAGSTAPFWGQRARLNIDIRNETEWGTLRGIYRLEGGDNNEDADVDMDVALISLAGFRAGFTGSSYWSSAYQTANFGSVGGNATGGFLDGGFDTFDDGTIFDYTWASDGFTVTVGIEDTRISYSSGGPANRSNSGAVGDDDEVNFYGGFTYANDLIDLRAVAAYDSFAADGGLESSAPIGAAGSRGGWAYRVSLGLDLSEYVPGGLLTGNYAYDGDYQTDYVHVTNILDDPESIWNIGFQANLTDEIEFLAQYSYAEGNDAPTAAGLVEGDAWLASVGFNWLPAAAPQFSVRASYSFGEVEDSLTAVGGSRNRTGTLTSYDFDQFTVGVRRDF